MLASCSAYSSTLKMEATCSFDKSVDFQRTAWRCIPGDRNLHERGCENLKFNRLTDMVYAQRPLLHGLHSHEILLVSEVFSVAVLLALYIKGGSQNVYV
jgi:hypothetical protein